MKKLPIPGPIFWRHYPYPTFASDLVLKYLNKNGNFYEYKVIIKGNKGERSVN